jgi:GGDEF domain-containing protein
VDESALIEIESRMQGYATDAREDIAQLIREIRRIQPAILDRAQHTAPHLHDSATGLLNAGAYGLRFSMARARARRYRNMFAVISIDFGKLAAASQGAALEPMLKEAAERMKGCLRATDTLARVADTSFAVILEDLNQPGQAERVELNVRDALAESLEKAAAGSAALVGIALEYHPQPPRNA